MLDKESKHYVTWGLVLDLFVSKMEATTEEQITSKKPPLDHENKFKPSLHSKRETINKIIGVCSGPTYVYIVVSMILQNNQQFQNHFSHFAILYDQNHYFGLGLIPKLKPKLADTFGRYRN